MKLFTRLSKKIIYGFSVIIIFTGILLLCSPFILTPILERHHKDFEVWASGLLDRPVTIGNIRISWFHSQPAINFYAVTILNKNNAEPIMQMQKVSVFFSLAQSLWQHKFVPSGLMISGADVHIHESSNGEITVQGFPALGGFESTPYQRESRITDVLGWLSQKPRLILHNVEIRYTGVNKQNRLITLYNFSLRNTSNEHFISGKATLHQKIPVEVTMAGQWTGEKFEPQEMNAKLYLDISGFSIAQWLKDFSWHEWQVRDGMGSAKIWATWDKGAFQKIQTLFQIYDLNLYSENDKATHLINRVSGNLGWQKRGEEQIIAGEDIFIDLPQHLWPGTSFFLSFSLAPDGSFVPKVLRAGYIDITDVRSFLPSTAPYRDELKIIDELHLTGSLLNTKVDLTNFNTTHQLSLNTQFNEISFHTWKNFPGVDHLSGDLNWNGEKGKFTASASPFKFEYPSLFANPITLDHFSAKGELALDPNKDFNVHDLSLQLQNSEFNAKVKGGFNISPAYKTNVDLTANFNILETKHIARYLPVKVFETGLTEWLSQAFLSGELKNANAILRGSIDDFPFDQGQGSFSIAGELHDIDLKYAASWPVLQHIEGNIFFEGRKIRVDAKRAETLGIPIRNIQANISDLGGEKPVILTVKSDKITGDVVQGLDFIKQSPLQETIGKMFTDLQMKGPMNLDLDLTIPLNDADKTKIQGNLEINHNELNLEAWNLSLKNLTGKIHFTEDETDAKNIQGELFNLPVQLDLATIAKTKDHSVVRATINHQLNISDLEAWLNVPFSKTVTGATNVQTQIDFAANHPLEMHFSSDLLGINLALPAPYGKKAEEKREFSADIFVAEHEPLRMKLGLDNQLHAAVVLKRKDQTYHLQSANINLGAKEADWVDKGLSITGEFDRLDLSQIKSYVEQPSTTQFSNLDLRDINIQVKNLEIFGQHIKQARLKVTPHKEDWQIEINSPTIVGQLQIPQHIRRDTAISAQFKKLKLVTQNNSQDLAINVESFPSIFIVANNVSYNDMSFGQITFNAIPRQNGLTIKTLKVNSSHLFLDAEGTWTDLIHLQGIANSPSVNELLNSLGFEAHNFVASDGKINFDLNWQASSLVPNLSSLDGHAGIKLGAGRVVDIGEEGGAKMGIGRMLSLFSLQTIPRRLALDFSDVVQKGYSFDSVQGNFSFHNGNAFTNDLHFAGPVAGLSINGRIGLKDKDYDLTLSVAPQVTGTIPVAATAATLLGVLNPVVGLAAVGANMVISPGVTKAVSHTYSVKGPWGNPSWHSLSTYSRK